MRYFYETANNLTIMAYLAYHKKHLRFTQGEHGLPGG